MEAAKSAVFIKSEEIELAETVQGHDFEHDIAQGNIDYDKLLHSFKTTGFQATNFGKAVEEINKMVRFKYCYW